jgi:hypothetical protein
MRAGAIPRATWIAAVDTIAANPNIAATPKYSPITVPASTLGRTPISIKIAVQIGHDHERFSGGAEDHQERRGGKQRGA